MLRWPVQIARRPAGFAIIGLMAALAVACPFALAEAGRSAKTVGNDAQQQLWVEGIRLAHSGSFGKAATRFDEVIAGGVQDPRVQKVDKWLHSLADLQSQRHERAEQDYRKYVEWVQQDLSSQKQDHRRGWWRLAILDCARAYNSAGNREAMVKEP